MRLTFLGIGAAYFPQLGNTGAYFWRNKTLYLLDCGALAFSQIIKLGLLEHAENVAVLVTHLHADHTGSLGTLISYCHHVTHLPVIVVHPEETLTQMLSLQGIRKSQYEWEAGLEVKHQGLSIAFHPVPHTDALKSYGLFLSDGENALFYSGDAAQVPAWIWQQFLSGEIHQIYQDMSFRAERPKGHGSYQEMLEKVPSERRKDIYPIHWDTDAKEKILQDGFGLADVVKEGE